MTDHVEAPAGAPGSRGRRAVYLVTTALAALAFLVPGVGNLVRVPHIAADMSHLGYPPYFLAILGTWKVLGALAVAAPGLPRVKEWAYAGMFFDLSGAAVSRAVMGDGAVMVVAPLVLAAVVWASWATRPASRRLTPRFAPEAA